MFIADKIRATISRGCRLDRDDDRIFVRSRLLERFELAVQQASRHEVLMPGGDAARDQGLVTLEIDQTNVGTIADQNIAVAALQRGTCDDAVSARSTRLVDPGGDRAPARAGGPRR